MSDTFKVLGGILLAAGVAVFMLARNGVNPASVTGLVLAGAGALCLLASDIGQGRRGSALKLAAGVLAFVLGLGGLVACLFGIIDEEFRGWLAPGCVALAAGLAGVGRSLWGQAGDAALALAPKLGFRTIEEDSDYAAEGIMNGVAVAYNMGHYRARRDPGPTFWLRVACGVPNPAGLALYAYGGGPGARPVRPLPPAALDLPAGWEDFAVHCEPAGADLRWLGRLRAGPGGAFGADSGLRVFELDGPLLKTEFSGPGLLDEAGLRARLDAVARAAAALRPSDIGYM